MDSAQSTCCYCDSPLGNNAPGKKAITKAVGSATSARLCQPCYIKVKGSSRLQKIRPQSSFATAAYALRALSDKKYENFLDADLSIDKTIRSIDGGIHGLIDKIQKMGEERTRMLSIKRTLMDALDKSPEASYEIRRLKANAFISRQDVRAAVFIRDGFKCKSCGTRIDLSIDHVVPVKLGGGDNLENFQTLCRSCNSAKGPRLQRNKMTVALEEAGLINP